VRHQAEPVQQLVGLDVVDRGRHIGRDQHGGNQANGEGARDDVDQVEGSGDSRHLARRSACDGIHE
jgi:hypothetical protein